MHRVRARVVAKGDEQIGCQGVCGQWMRSRATTPTWVLHAQPHGVIHSPRMYPIGPGVIAMMVVLSAVWVFGVCRGVHTWRGVVEDLRGMRITVLRAMARETQRRRRVVCHIVLQRWHTWAAVQRRTRDEAWRVRQHFSCVRVPGGDCGMLSALFPRSDVGHVYSLLCMQFWYS